MDDAAADVRHQEVAVTSTTGMPESIYDNVFDDDFDDGANWGEDVEEDESNSVTWQMRFASEWFSDMSMRWVHRVSSKRLPQVEDPAVVSSSGVRSLEKSRSRDFREVQAGMKDESKLRALLPGEAHVVVDMPRAGAKVTTRKAPKLAMKTRFAVWYTMYRKLFTLILTANIALLTATHVLKLKHIEELSIDISVANVLLSVLFRSEGFLRVVFFLITRILNPIWTPRFLAVFATDILHHLGGIHSGAAFGSILWLAASQIDSVLSTDKRPLPAIILAWTLLAFLLLVTLGAMPIVRRLYHNSFEISHRFLGWTSLAILWASLLLTHSYVSFADHYEIRPRRILSSPAVWATAAVTVIIVFPWLSVRRLRVTSIVSPAKDNVVIRFSNGITAGLFVRISRRPLLEWHTFAAVGMKGGAKADHHLVIASALGDFTKGLASEPPTHLWVRTIRFAGVPYCLRMFKRATAVCTGAGIAPMLSSMLQKTCAINLVWVARTIDQSFTPEIAAMVMGCDNVLLWDTKKQGRPNLVELTATAVREFCSEVVIITSNPSGTKRLLEGLHERGIPAFGPTWDS